MSCIEKPAVPRPVATRKPQARGSAHEAAPALAEARAAARLARGAGRVARLLLPQRDDVETKVTTAAPWMTWISWTSLKSASSSAESEAR